MIWKIPCVLHSLLNRIVPWGKAQERAPRKPMVPRAVVTVPGGPKEDAALDHQDKNPTGEPGNESLPVFLLALIKLFVILVNYRSSSLPFSVFFCPESLFSRLYSALKAQILIKVIQWLWMTNDLLLDIVLQIKGEWPSSPLFINTLLFFYTACPAKTLLALK